MIQKLVQVRLLANTGKHIPSTAKKKKQKKRERKLYLFMHTEIQSEKYFCSVRQFYAVQKMADQKIVLKIQTEVKLFKIIQTVKINQCEPH